MIGDARVLAVITARGGSKGLPGKNVMDLAGKPLIAWTIEAARGSRYVDRLILSSDDREIMRTAEKWGCEVPFVRPAALADDKAKSEDTVLHALDALGEEYDYVVLLQPTSPFRLAEDIDACLRRCRENGAPSCVSVTEVDKPPEWMYRSADGVGLKPVLSPPVRATRRQDLAPAYAVNGAVYAADVQWFREGRRFVGPETVAYFMPRERAVDIDDRFDFDFATFLATRGKAKPE